MGKLPLLETFVVDSGQLVEMELRKRALESELKRTKLDDKSLPTSGNPGDLESSGNEAQAKGTSVISCQEGIVG